MRETERRECTTQLVEHLNKPLTDQECQRLLDLDVIEEAHRLRALGWPPLQAMHAALGRPPLDISSPRPVTARATSSLPPAQSHGAPAGVFFAERRADQRRVSALVQLLVLAGIVLALLVLSALLGGQK